MSFSTLPSLVSPGSSQGYFEILNLNPFAGHSESGISFPWASLKYFVTGISSSVLSSSITGMFLEIQCHSWPPIFSILSATTKPAATLLFSNPAFGNKNVPVTGVVVAAYVAFGQL